MNFKNHYFTEEQITEINWTKSKFLGNAFRALAGSGKRRINPKDFKIMTELTSGGFSEMFGVLDNRYQNQKNRKHFIKDLKTAVINPKDTQDVFKTKEGVIQIDDPQQIKAASYYVTNKGGRIALFHILDDEKEEKYFIGLDGNALKFFNAPIKQGGIGKDFKTWLSVQSIRSYRPDTRVISPEFAKSDSKEKSGSKTIKHRFEISQSQFDKMIPDEGTQPQEFRLAASNNSFDLFNLFNEEVLEEKNEKTKYVFKDKDGKWIIASSPKNNPIEMSYNPKKDYIAVKTDEPIGSTDKVKQLEKDTELQKELNIWKKEQADKEGTEKETGNEEEKETGNEEKEKPDLDVKQIGQIAYDLHDELQNEPEKMKPSKNIQYSWRYLFQNGGTLFAYETKEGKHRIAYDDKAKQIIDKKKLTTKYGLQRAIEPE